LDYTSTSLEEPGSCIFYHRDALEHPGGSVIDEQRGRTNVPDQFLTPDFVRSC
jgi:hypothetical protein